MFPKTSPQSQFSPHNSFPILFTISSTVSLILLRSLFARPKSSTSHNCKKSEQREWLSYSSIIQLYSLEIQGKNYLRSLSHISWPGQHGCHMRFARLWKDRSEVRTTSLHVYERRYSTELFASMQSSTWSNISYIVMDRNGRLLTSTELPAYPPIFVKWFAISSRVGCNHSSM